MEKEAQNKGIFLQNLVPQPGLPFNGPLYMRSEVRIFAKPGVAGRQTKDIF